MASATKKIRTDRDAQAKLMANRRSEGRDIQITAPADWLRRLECEADVYRFLETYFPKRFTNPWNDNQRDMINGILRRARYGGDQSIAAPRGEGKTTIAECVTIFSLFTGILRFPLLVAATGPDAERILSNIRAEIEFNDLLAEDYPEICTPVRALEGAHQRCGMQTVAGVRTRMKWSEKLVVFPRVQVEWCNRCGSESVSKIRKPVENGPTHRCRICKNEFTPADSVCSGSVLMTRGLDAAIRGIRHESLRPDFILIDDPETRESARSFTQIEVREKTVDQDLGGMGGPGKKIARVMLCTIMNPSCLSAKFTDPKQKPSWNGQRHRLIVEKPDREDLWEEYIQLRQTGMQTGDLDGRGANQLYLDKQSKMDAGSIVSNPHRFNAEKLPDGSQTEVSALQHCYNIIADRGIEAFQTEYQNDPPKDDSEETSGITPLIVRQSLNGLEQGVVPMDTQKLTAFIDVGKYRLHYVVVAWRTGSTGYVVDYGEKYTPQPNVIGTDKAILTALREWRDERLGEPYFDEDGEAVALNLCLIDSGYADSTVFSFVKEAGSEFMASMGDPRFRQPNSRTADKKPGSDHWYRARRENRMWAVNMDADHWKHLVHDRFLMEHVPGSGGPALGSFTLFGDDAMVHGNFAKQICAEIWTREWKDTSAGGKTLKEYWKKTQKDNHYLDCMYGACVAASVCGVQMNVHQITRQRRKVKLSQMRTK